MKIRDIRVSVAPTLSQHIRVLPSSHIADQTTTVDFDEQARTRTRLGLTSELSTVGAASTVYVMTWSSPVSSRCQCDLSSRLRRIHESPREIGQARFGADLTDWARPT
jgi:hypothetical protein